jgi:two-component system, OmpR family, sensor histidine kinase KdpD
MATKSQTNSATGALKEWFTSNTVIPPWFPKRVRHPLSVYSAAGVIQIVAIGLTMGLVAIAPDFTFRGALILLGVIGVAMTMGGGPGLVASFVGATLLDFLLIPPIFSFSQKKGADVLNVVFYLIVCLATNLAAAHAQQTRQLAATKQPR